MAEKQTTLIPWESNPERNFAFDYSYWSFDGFKVESDGYLSPEANSRYADQKKVFNELGSGILENAFNGYNSTLFAYGQTGSGTKMQHFFHYS